MNLLFLSNSDSLFSGFDKSLSKGAIAAITTMLFVFIILALIIAVSYGISNLIKKLDSKKQSTKPKGTVTTPVTQAKNPLDVNDEDAVVAALIASIDYRNEIKKDIRVVSIKEIK